MKKLLTIPIFAVALSLHAATGDITGMSIEPNGWICDIWFSGLTTNGTFAYGLGVDNAIVGTEKLTFQLTSKTLDSTTLTTNTVSRTLFGVRRVRYPYPISDGIGGSFADTTNDANHGGDLRVKISLSQHVFSGDSSITATVLPGIYSGGGTSAGATAFPVTNASTLNYNKTIANWSWPGWNRVTNSTLRLRAPGFSYFAQNGFPLKAMRFILTDEHGISRTNIETQMRIDNTLPSPNFVGEYCSDFDTSVFTDHDQLRGDFEAVSWVGDGYSTLATTANLYVYPLPASITNFLDRAQNYAPFIAVVDNVSGSDLSGGGRATNTIPGNVNSAHYFASITAAWNALTASNNLYASPTHNDPGGGIVYLRTTANTFYAWTGGTLSAGAGTMAKCWAETATFPGDAQAVITNRANDRNVGHRVKLTNIKIATPAAAVPFNAIGALWFNSCVLSNVSTAPIQACTNIFLTYGSVTNTAENLKAFTSQYSQFSLVRGVNFDGYSGGYVWYTCIGCYKGSSNGVMTVYDYNTAINAPPPDYAILYNCKWLGLANNPSFSIGGFSDITNGCAVVQNVFESVNNSGYPSTVAMAALNSSGAHNSLGVLYQYNVTIGERTADIASNATESNTNVSRTQWSMAMNISELNGFKKDYDGTKTNRTANWSVMWQVGSWGNVYAESLVNSAAGSFPPDSVGLNSTYATYSGEATATGGQNAIGWVKYFNRQAYAGDGVRAPGGGDYRVLSDSPVQPFGVQKPKTWLLPFDIDGNPRGINDPPGAFAAAVPTKGGAFFGQ